MQWIARAPRAASTPGAWIRHRTVNGVAVGNRRLEHLQLIVSGLANGCVYGLIALGFVLVYKAAEQVNFAQGDLMMLGAFVAVGLANEAYLACRSGSRALERLQRWPRSAGCWSGRCCATSSGSRNWRW